MSAALSAVPDTPDDDVEAPAAPPMLHANLDDALAAFHVHLPVIAKELEARVETNKGRNYSYEYADLATVSHAVLPRLGAQGLAWATRPTREGGQLVLHYRLRHGASGEEITGEWDLGRGTFQELGSAITYARRYCLLAVTGTFPGGEDDDGAEVTAAQREEREEAREQARAERERERAARAGGGHRGGNGGGRPNGNGGGQRPGGGLGGGQGQGGGQSDHAGDAMRHLLGRRNLDDARKAAAWVADRQLVDVVAPVSHAIRRSMNLPEGELTLGAIATHMVERFEDAAQTRQLEEGREATAVGEVPTGPVSDSAEGDHVTDPTTDPIGELEGSGGGEHDVDPWAGAPAVGEQGDEPPY